ncbi:MAG TPA: cache domain-containing protein [Panacibacter sp.]|nr:cache domain-containing protein [Panacibacter sp.]HNP45832.1 cache domain-containing protein [Panacibacter sp.]
MRKLFSFGRSQAVIFFTLFLVILFTAVYIFVYIPGKESELKEDHFRSLQKTDANIDEKLANMVALLNNLLQPYTNADRAGDTVLINEYVAGRKKTSWRNFELDEIQTKSTAAFAQKNPAIYDQLDHSEKKEVKLLNIDSTLRRFSITVFNEKNDSVFKASLAIDFKKFFAPVLPGDIFDQYIVFNDADPIYESFPSGVTYTKNDSAVRVDKEIQSSVVRDISIGGVDYKMFLQPMNFDVSHHWVIAGLLTTSRYNAEAKKLPTGIILLLVTISIIIIVVFPWIKLFQLGRNNMLTLTDGISSVVVSILLMSLLFFVFFRYNGFWRQDHFTGSDSTVVIPQKALADKLSSAFTNEISNRYKELSYFDSIQSGHAVDSTNTAFYKTRAGTNIKDAFNTIGGLKDRADSRAFVKVLWIDSNASEQYYWVSNSFFEQHVYNLWQRDYYKNLKPNGRPFYMDSDEQKPYYVDQVVSKVDGLFRSIVSKPSQASHATVVAYAFVMQCLSNTVMPAGYNYAITDNKGKVLYASDSTRNLNENLLEEFSDSESLREAYVSHKPGELRTDYYDKKYKAYVKPVDGLPYFVVVLADTAYKSTRDAEVYSFTFSMMLFLFLLLVIQVFATMVASYNRWAVPGRHYVTNWLWPKAKYHSVYKTVALVNVLNMLLLAFTFRYAEFTEYLLGLLTCITVSIFLAVLLACKIDEEVPNRKLWILMLLFILVPVVLAVNFLDDFFSAFTLITTASLAIGVTAYLAFKKPVTESGDNRPRWSHVHSYTLMNVTRLIITSGIPVVLFYVTSFNYEQGLLTRYRQLDFAEQLISKFSSKAIAGFTKTGTQETRLNNVIDFTANGAKAATGSRENTGYGSAVYKDGKWVKQVGLTDTLIDTSVSRQHRATAAMLNAFRYYKNNESVTENDLFINQSQDKLYSYNDRLFVKPGEVGDTALFQRNLGIGNAGLVLKSVAPLYLFPGFGSLNEKLFWLSLLVSIWLFYQIMLAVTKKLFSFSFHASDTPLFPEKLTTGNGAVVLTSSLYIVDLADNNFFKELQELLNTNRLFIAAADGNRQQLQQKNNAGLTPVFREIDFIHLPDSKMPNDKDFTWQKIVEDYKLRKPGCVLIKNLDYNLYNTVTDYARISFLETLIADHCVLIFTSSKAPADLFDSSISIIGTMPDVEKRKLNEYKKRLKAIFKKCSLLYYPLTRRRDYHQFTAFETGIFYNNLWSSLAEGEQFILYDLAKDGLVNVHDQASINMLIGKGIIVCDNDNHMKVFAKGFSDFVLRILSNEEFSQVQSHIEDNGNWNRLRVPLIVVIAGLLVLLFSSQETVYSKLIGYIGAFAAGVPTIIKLFSIFDKPDNNKQ